MRLLLVQMESHHFHLTLTSVVFESINAIAIPNDNDDLTLTSVVFEFNIHIISHLVSL